MKTARKTAMKTAKEVQVEVKPVHFVILVSLETDSDGDQYTVPRNIPRQIHRGDTVSYESPDGKVTVEFDKDKDGSDHTSPYVGATGDLQTVEGGVVLNVVNKGTYFGKCFITRTVPVFEVMSSPTAHEPLPLDPKLSPVQQALLGAWRTSAGLMQTHLPANGDPVTVKVRTETIGWKEKDSSKQHGPKQPSPKQDNSEEVELESGGNHIVKP